MTALQPLGVASIMVCVWIAAGLLFLFLPDLVGWIAWHVSARRSHRRTFRVSRRLPRAIIHVRAVPRARWRRCIAAHLTEADL